MKKLFFRISLFSLLIEVGTSPLRAFSLMLCAVVTFVLFFIFQYFASRKYQERLKAEYLLLYSLVGCSFFQVPIRIWWFNNTLGSLPDFLFHLLGIVLGYLFYKSNKTFRIIILIFSLSSCFFLYFKGYDMWLHKLNYETFSGTIKDNNLEYNLTFQINTGDTLSLSDFKGKYLLLDCWYTYCGSCYRAMPKMQKLYDTHRENNSIVVSSMHSYIKNVDKRLNDGKSKKEDYTTGSEILKEEDCTYPCWAIDIENPILRELGVSVYPTVLIFDRQSNLIFRGNIENAERLIKKLLKEK